MKASIKEIMERLTLDTYLVMSDRRREEEFKKDLISDVRSQLLELNNAEQVILDGTDGYACKELIDKL